MALELRLDPASNVPPFRQLIEHLRAAILSGALQPGEQLPSAREMAAALSINALTVARALNELESAGLVHIRWGKGTFVKPLTTSQREGARRGELGRAVREFLVVANRLGFSPKDAAKAVRTAPRFS